MATTMSSSRTVKPALRRGRRSGLPAADICVFALATRLAEVPGDVEARLRHGFALCLGRPPTPPELAALRRHHDDQLALGDARAALLATARLLLNLDEFITRE